MDQVAQKLASTSWDLAEQDPATRNELTRRIVETARRQELITYSDLVTDVTFHRSKVNGGRPFQIDTRSWSERDRHILGDFLSSIAAESYSAHGFLISAVVVNKENQRPSDPFFNWAHSILRG